MDAQLLKKEQQILRLKAGIGHLKTRLAEKDLEHKDLLEKYNDLKKAGLAIGKDHALVAHLTKYMEMYKDLYDQLFTHHVKYRAKYEHFYEQFEGEMAFIHSEVPTKPEELVK